jgi:hypothetical protein
MKTDGSSQERISEEFSRMESLAAGGNCTAIGGIFSFRGWSSNSQWIAFTYVSPSERESPKLYIVNIQTRETRLVAHDSFRSVWSSNSQELATVFHDYSNIESDHIEIVNVDHPQSPPTILPIPAQLPETYSLLNIHWNEDDSALLALGSENSSKPVSLWKIDIANKNWTKLADLDIPSADLSLNVIGNQAVMCSSEGGIGKLTIIDLFDGRSLAGAESAEAVCATVNHLAGSSVLVGFVALENSDIWIIDVSITPLSFQKIISADVLDVPNGLKVIYMSWRPN